MTAQSLAKAITRAALDAPGMHMLTGTIQAAPSGGFVSVGFADGAVLSLKYNTGLTLTAGNLVVVLAENGNRVVAFRTT